MNRARRSNSTYDRAGSFSRNRGRNFSYPGSRGGNSGGGNRRRIKKEFIPHEKLNQVARPREEVKYIPKNQFNDFKIAEILKKNLEVRKITTPSAIQDEAINLILEGRDLIGIANTGTGKTLAFGLPILNTLMTDKSSRALIVAPTRELAEQILEEFKLTARGSNLFGTLVIGGVNIDRQIRDVKQDPNVIIGTPGRLKDLIERGVLKLGKFNLIVLDEVDRMLDMGFVDDVSEILNCMSDDRQSLFFSATMDPRVESLIAKFSSDPVTVSVKTGETTDNVHQESIKVSTEAKFDTLLDIVNDPTKKILIFDDTQKRVERLSDNLNEYGLKAESMHGGKSQSQRQRALKNFKEGRANIMVATDVAARGIDVFGVTHVINYSTPQSYSDYVHRIGRAGRAGKEGWAITFVD